MFPPTGVPPLPQQPAYSAAAYGVQQQTGEQRIQHRMIPNIYSLIHLYHYPMHNKHNHQRVHMDL